MLLDEITQYQDARYLSSSESCWRIFHYCLHQQYPAVVRLASHLENEQICYFRENISNDDLISVLEKSKQTTLTEWFVTNKIAFNKLKETNLSNSDREFYQKTLQSKYLDFSELYCWNKSKKKWTKRKQQNNTFSRIYFVPANDSEQYYLRVLLTHVRGATSFSHLKIVNNQQHNSYKDTCIALGLLEDDSHFFKCLNDAKDMQTGKQLRYLFSLILIFNIIQKPFLLWEKFKDDLCEDLLYNCQQKSRNPNLILNEEIENQALIEIENQLKYYHKSINNKQGIYIILSFNKNNINILFFICTLGFPKLKIIVSDNPFIYKQLDYNPRQQLEYFHNNYSMLNTEQKQFADEILLSLRNQQLNQLFFVYGYGGCGKTFLFNTILARVRANSEIALAMGSTGIASILLEGGNTAHSTLNIPIPATSTSVCSFVSNSPTADLIRRTKLFIWDEAPTMNKDVFETVDRSFRDILKNNKPFGGNSNLHLNLKKILKNLIFFKSN